jgi:hypothetical protein
MASGEDVALYYALDTSRLTLFQLRQSLGGVMRYSPGLPIYVAVAGELPPQDQNLLQALHINIISLELEKDISPTFMKWRALSMLPPCRDLIYLDTDTLLFGEPMRLFEFAGPQDFYARPELACDQCESAFPYRLNVSLVTRSIVDHWLMSEISGRLGARVMPILNTGVMLFRNGSAQKISQYWDGFVRLARRFRRKQLPFPCRNSHLLEEMVAPLVLGSLPCLTWGQLPAEACSFYLEYRGQNEHPTGVVLHTMSALYSAALWEFVGKYEALEYENLEADQPGLAQRAREWLKSLRLLLGTTFVPVPRSWLAAWIRAGAMAVTETREQSSVAALPLTDKRRTCK